MRPRFIATCRGGPSGRGVVQHSTPGHHVRAPTLLRPSTAGALHPLAGPAERPKEKGRGHPRAPSLSDPPPQPSPSRSAFLLRLGDARRTPRHPCKWVLDRGGWAGRLSPPNIHIANHLPSFSPYRRLCLLNQTRRPSFQSSTSTSSRSMIRPATQQHSPLIQIFTRKQSLITNPT